MIIYTVTNKTNGKQYIGQTINDLEKRKTGHIYSALNKIDNTHFHNAIRKHSPDNFEWAVLDSARNIDELNELEIFFIKLFNTFEDGYNHTIGGRYSNTRFSAESRKKISEGQFGNKNHMYGKNGNAHHFFGKHHSTEAKLKMSESTKGEKHPMYGKHRSIETKRRISESNKGKQFGKDSPKAKAVIINNQYFDTIIEASLCLNIPRSTIHYRIKRQVPDYHYAL